MRVALLALILTSCTAALPSPGGAGTRAPSPPPVAANAVSEEIVVRSNAERQRAGLPALRRSEQLMRAAQLHAEQMAERQQLAHVLPGAAYPTLESRLAAVGYLWRAIAENVSWNQESAGDAVASWMRSAGHRSNLLSGAYVELGAGYAVSRRGEPYFVQVFATPR